MELFEILLPLALILATTKALGLLAKKLGLPQVIGMLIGGLLLGLLKYIPSNTINHILFSDKIKEWLSVLGEIGVVLIMFSTGLGTNLNRLKSSGKASVVITCFGVIVPLLLGFLIAWGFGQIEGVLPLLEKAENPFIKILGYLFYGAILTATSVSVTVSALKELGKLDTKVGTSIVAAAVIDDIIGIVILSVFTGLSGGGKTDYNGYLPSFWVDAPWWLVIIKIVLFFALAIGSGILIRKLFKHIEVKYPHNRRVPIYSLCICFLFAYIAEEIFGVADITGAYVAGLIIGGTLQETPYVEKRTDQIGYLVFSPIFFANIGLKLDFREGGGFTWMFLIFGILYVIIALISKVGGCYIASRICKYDRKDSLRVGIGMMVRAEVILICTEKGINANLIERNIYPFIFLIIILSSILAPFLLKLSYKKDTNPLLENESNIDPISKSQIEIQENFSVNKDETEQKSN